MVKAFSELSEREILALAISLEEDDAGVSGDYADRLKADYPETAKMLTTMRDETGACTRLHGCLPGAIWKARSFYPTAGHQGLRWPEASFAGQSADHSAGAQGGRVDGTRVDALLPNCRQANDQRLCTQAARWIGPCRGSP